MRGGIVVDFTEMKDQLMLFRLRPALISFYEDAAVAPLECSNTRHVH